MTPLPARQAHVDAIAGASHETDRCPKCGSPLEFNSDGMGYGRTVEQCSRFPKCDHWRTLEKIVLPAHTPPPKGPETPRPGSLGELRRRGSRGQVAERIVAALPRSAAAALTRDEVAARAGHAPVPTGIFLANALRQDRYHVRQVAVPGQRLRRWWRAA
jgi:hypothetical protein